MAESLNIKTEIENYKSQGLGLDEIAYKLSTRVESNKVELTNELISLLDEETSSEAYVAAKILIDLKIPKGIMALIFVLQKLIEKKEDEFTDIPNYLSIDFDASLAELLSSSSLTIRDALKKIDSKILTDSLIEMAREDIRQTKDTLRVLETLSEWTEFVNDLRPQIVEIEKDWEKKRWEQDEERKKKLEEAKVIREELKERRGKFSKVEEQINRIMSRIDTLDDIGELEKLQKSAEDVAMFARTLSDFTEFLEDKIMLEYLTEDIERTKASSQKVEDLLASFESRLQEKRSSLS